MAGKTSLKNIAAQAKGFWQTLSPGRRISLLVVVGVTVISFAGIAAYILAEDYRLLVGNLSSEDTQAIGKLLRDQNIPTRLTPTGDGLMVPADKLDEARLSIATEGLAQGGGTGFELFDRSDIGMTSFREQVNFRRALEGELSRTIRRIGAVRSARVHIVLPHHAIFKEDRRPASASIVVNLHAGKKLDGRQVKGIRALVGSAVEGLDPERVTILDGRGAVLARMGDGIDGSGGGERLDYQRRMERRLEDRIHALLEPLVGAGKVVAQVTAEVDYRRIQEMNESYSPDRTVVRSEQRSSESRLGAQGRAKGVPGARSNLPGGTPQPQGASGEKYQKESEVINYEVDKRILKTEHATGSLKRLSVAVVVDGSLVAGEGDEAAPTYKARSPQELDRFESLVKKAIGFDAKRGDQVEVSNVAFEAPEPVEESTFAFLTGLDMGPILRIFGLLALALVVLLLVLRPAMRAIAPAQPEILLKPGHTATVVEMERRLLQQGPENGLASQEMVADRTSGLIESGQEDPAMVAVRLAQQNPHRVVQVVKGWLDGESG